jgi:signal recognition particle receptor subunit beta
VIDASDHARLQEAREELLEVLEDEVMKGVPCLILANKQDRPGAMGVNELAERLNLREIHGRPWHIKVRIGIVRTFFY